MTAKRSIRDLERQCKKEPDNLVVRLLLAAAYREIGRTSDAIPLYRSVADSYQRLGRRTQAVAVLKSLLELDPVDPDTRTLLDRIDRETSGAAMPVPTGPPPVLEPLPPSLPLPSSRASSDMGSVSRSRTGAPPGARVLAEDVVVRELTPVRPPGVPASVRSLGKTPPPPAPPTQRNTPSLASTLSGLGTAGPGKRGSSPSKGSAATFTPTPLPTPIPFHEVDASGPHPRAPSDHDAQEIDDALTRIAPDYQSKKRPSTTGEVTAPEADLAADLDTRRVRRLTEDELDVVAQPPPGMTSPVQRFDSADLEPETDPDAQPGRRHEPALEDELTRLADESGGRAGEVEGPTGVRRAIGGRSSSRPASRAAHPISKAAAAVAPRPTKPLPTPPVAAPPPRPPEPLKRPAPVAQRPPTTVRPAPLPKRPEPEPADGEDDQTRVAPDMSSRQTGPIPGDRGHLVGSTRADTHDTDRTRDSGGITRDTGPLTPEEQTDVQDDASSEPGRHRSRTFAAQGFASTLEEMDPDGSAIEAPLDVFSILPPDALAELGRRMTLRSYAPGDLVIREGEPGDACYVIADGEVRVLKNDPLDPEAGPVEVARLGARSLFGEFALLADRRRHATVQATSHVSVYEIPRALLRELAASYADVGPALESFYRQRLLATLLRTAPFFMPLPEDFRARLLARFMPIRAESGEPIVREGQPAGGLYLIIIGAVEITRRVGKQRSVILASLREGAYFGEMSLLSGGPTTATVVAAGPVELALLPPRDFYDIVAQHPQLWAQIRHEAKSRALENAKLLAGYNGTV